MVRRLCQTPVFVTKLNTIPCRCPRCGKLAIKTRLTSYFNGSTRVTLRYNNCFYYRKLEKVGGGGGGG